MGIYLDNAVSTKAAPNENLGRELLELHTVGRAAGYTEDRRQELRPDPDRLPGRHVEHLRGVRTTPSDHWTGPVTVMDFHHPNAARRRPSRSREAYLDYLARHPRTAAPDRPQAGA